MRPFFTLPILLLALFSYAAPAMAEPVVVVNARNNVRQLSQDEVINIFLGRYRRFPGGAAATPIDQPESSPLRAEFYRKLVNKELDQINAYWSRLIFSGKTSPPKQAANAHETIQLLLSHPGGIAYFERNQVDNRFRIIMEFPR
jgi:ABC-type phosphate transport system substrate-binding protein